MTTGDDPLPHEPEIEFLGRLARRALQALRGLFFTAGCAATLYGVLGVLWPRLDVVRGLVHGVFWADEPQPPVHRFVWLCVGIPLLLPTDWLFGRGRLPMLALGTALWFGPALLADDSDYGFVLRLFASLVAVATLLVWRTLSGLTSGPSTR